MIPSKKMNWVLLRGLARESRHWDKFLKLLSDQYENILPLELPGVAAKIERNCPWKIESYISGLRSEFNKLKGEGNWSILGISLGGMVTLSWISMFPHDFKYAVIINSSCGGLVPLKKRLNFDNLWTIGKLLISNDLSKREKTILEMTTNLNDVSNELIQKRVQWAKEYPFSRLTFIKQLVGGHLFKFSNIKASTKILFLASANDHLVSVDSSKIMAKKIKSLLRIHPKAGHDLPLDDPLWVIQNINEFMEERGVNQVKCDD